MPPSPLRPRNNGLQLATGFINAETASSEDSGQTARGEDVRSPPYGPQLNPKVTDADDQVFVAYRRVKTMFYNLHFVNRRVSQPPLVNRR